MKVKNITTRTSPDKIVSQFKDVLKNGGAINLKMPWGYISAVGGDNPILTKLQNDKQYFACQGEWKEWII